MKEKKRNEKNYNHAFICTIDDWIRNYHYTHAK